MVLLKTDTVDYFTIDFLTNVWRWVDKKLMVEDHCGRFN